MILTCPSCSSRFMVDAAALGDEGRTVRCASCKHEWFAVPDDERAGHVEEFDEIEDVHFTEEEDDETSLEDDVFQEIDEDHEDEENTDDSQEAFEEDAFPLDDDEMPDFAAIEVQAAKQSNAPQGKGLWIAGCLVLLLVMVSLILLLNRHSLGSAGSALAPLYKAIGYADESGVMLADVTLKELPSRRKKRYQLFCNIVNTMEEERAIPALSMQIINGDGDVLAEEANMLELEQKTLDGGSHVECGDIQFEVPFSTAKTLVLDLGSPYELSLRDAWEPKESKEE